MKHVIAWDEVYSNLMHDSAERWGLAVLPGRPLLDDGTDPYPNPEPVETLEWGDGWRSAKITLVTLNGQWSFCLDVAHWGVGALFGPRRKFCNPHPTRHAALCAAVEAVHHLRPDPDLAAWLDCLIAPVQMTLF